MTSSPVLLQNVAERAGVSIPTASLVLNGHHAKARIAESTRERVLEAASALGYQANPFASSLRSKRSYSIGVLWSFSGPHHSSLLLREFSGRALERGYTTLVFDSMSDYSLMERQLRELAKRRVEGLIMSSFHGSDLRIEKLLKGIPNVVFVTRELVPDHEQWGQVVHSSDSAFKQAAAHLTSQGRKRFGFVGVMKGNERKLQTISNALKVHGIEEGISATLNFPTPELLSLDERRHLLRQSQILEMDAIFCGTDEVAAAVIAASRLEGRSVPDDFAVIGFNNSPISGLFDIPIASVERYDNLVAVTAIETMIRRIEGEVKEPSVVPVIEMKFIPRASAGEGG